MYSKTLPDVQAVNVNHRDSWQEAITHHFRNTFKQSSLKNILLSIITIGVYPYKKYKKSKRAIIQSIAARKIFYFKSLQDNIEEIRKEQTHNDPRKSLNSIYMKLQSEKVNSDENAIEFKAIYYPNELLLFITNPIRDRKSIRLHHLKSRKHLDYLRMWYELKKKASINQYRQIQNINFCNKTLKEEYCLAPEGIHDRLSRSAVFKKKPYLLTKFKELGKAFQEIVLAYQDFDDLSDQNPELYHLIETLSKTSQKDIEILQTYLASRYLPRNLPLANRRQLIQLANQQEVLYHMSEDEQFGLCAFILNRYQWGFLLSIQQVSDITLGLLDWAFEESPTAMKKELSFLEKIYAGIEKKVIQSPQEFPNLNEKIEKDLTLNNMTLDFANELNREVASLNIYEGTKLFYNMAKTESLSMDQLIENYKAIQKICATDNTMFSLLQQALSQVGKNAFQSAIEEGMMSLLGEKSEYFLPILSNSNINIVKINPSKIQIIYTFEQLIIKKGEVQQSFEKEKYMVIDQTLIKKDNHWMSPEANVKIAVKNKVP